MSKTLTICTPPLLFRPSRVSARSIVSPSVRSAVSSAPFNRTDFRFRGPASACRPALRSGGGPRLVRGLESPAGAAVDTEDGARVSGRAEASGEEASGRSAPSRIGRARSGAEGAKAKSHFGVPGRSGADESGRAGSPEMGTSMAGMLDLEKQFSFYGAYHSNKVNIFIHILFVWPIFYTSLILWAYTPAFAPLPLPGGALPLQQYMVINFSFIQAGLYALYYVALDKKAGSLGAAICLACWIAANAVAQALPWSLAWKIVLASQVTCWVAQIYGHQKHEGRAPALLDNLPQAFLMAPFFVLLECLQSIGYEPYPGFREKVHNEVDGAIREFRATNGKKVVFCQDCMEFYLDNLVGCSDQLLLEQYVQTSSCATFDCLEARKSELSIASLLS